MNVFPLKLKTGQTVKIGVLVEAGRIIPVDATIGEHGLAVHRSVVMTTLGYVQGENWSVTDTETGRVVGYGDTPDQAWQRALVRLKILAGDAGIDFRVFLARIRDAQKARQCDLAACA